MRFLDHQYTDKKVSPWGGMRLIHELYVRCGLREAIRELGLKKPGSNRGFAPADIVEGFLVSVILGARRLSHSGLLKEDEVIREIFGWSRGMASQSTFSRFFSKYELEDNDELFPALMRWWFEQFRLDKYTVDLDSTVLTRYGHQEGVEEGYNPGKKGRGSHHPLLAFAAELNMVVNAWMRPGNSAASTDFDAFFDQTLDVLPADKIGLLRADAGFYGDKVLQCFEDKGLKYIVSARLNAGLAGMILEQRAWYPVLEGSEGLEYCTFPYAATRWKKARRFVVVRKLKEKYPDSGGKTLFPKYEAYDRYKYSAFVTNTGFSAPLVWQLYNKRADCENRIKELKQDYGIEGFCLKRLGATENAFRWIMVAHNLMSLFKLQVLRRKKKIPQLSTLNLQCIAIGSFLTRSARKTTLKLSVAEKRRRFFDELFMNLGDSAPPYSISIA